VINVKRTGLGEAECSILDGDAFSLNEPRNIKAGSAIHRTLQALQKDFYRPIALGELYESVFNEKYFDPFAAHNRIHQIVRRVRVWIKENDLRWEIQLDERGLLFLNGAGSALRLQTERDKLPLDPAEVLLLKCFQAFGLKPFELWQVLDRGLCTKAQAQGCLAKGIEGGRVERTGIGRSIRYRFPKQPSKC
jgi:hypothetical protein